VGAVLRALYEPREAFEDARQVGSSTPRDDVGKLPCDEAGRRRIARNVESAHDTAQLCQTLLVARTGRPKHLVQRDAQRIGKGGSRALSQDALPRLDFAE
jgi:transcriptional regulator of met regulon